MSSLLLQDSHQKILVEKLNQLFPYLIDKFAYYRKSLANRDLTLESIEDLAQKLFNQIQMHDQVVSLGLRPERFHAGEQLFHITAGRLF